MPGQIPSPELSAHIQRQIDDLRPPSSEGWHPGAWPTRVCVEELGALPIWADLIFTWALCPDGTVLRMDRDSLFHPTEPETDPFTRYAVLEQASRMDPELRVLVPDAPAGTRRCTTCGGTGMQESRGQEPPRTVECGSCGGMGWIVRPDPPGGAPPPP